MESRKQISAQYVAKRATEVTHEFNTGTNRNATLTAMLSEMDQ